MTNGRVLTVADDGITISMLTGQQVTVVLEPGGQWHRPATSSGALVLVSASGGYPTTMPASAVFRAVRPGTALMTSATDAACLHAKPPCAIPQRGWRVTVIVSAS